MKKVIVGDSVKVIAGAGKGKVGVVQKVLLKKGFPMRHCVIVSGVNIRKYVKKGPTGSKFEMKEFPVDASNILLVSGENGEVSRVGFKFCDGVKKRYLKKTGVVI